MNEKDWKALVLKHKLTGSPLIFGDDYDKCEVIGIDDKFDGTVVIPKGVLGIRPNCFEASSIKGVVISDSVSEIGCSAFRRCYSLESVKYSHVLSYISENCFSECWNLSILSGFDNVVLIKSEAFSYCYMLKDFNQELFPRLQNMEKMIFLKSGLENIIFSDTVKVMYRKCFERCDRLKFVDLSNFGDDVDCRGFDITEFVYNNSKRGCKFILPDNNTGKLLKGFLVEV